VKFLNNKKTVKKINNIDNEIEKIINRLGLKDRYLLFRIQHYWQEIVGAYLANHTLPQRFFNNELTIHTDSAGISSEIHFFQTEIRKKLKQLFDIDSITKIHARIGTRKPLAEQTEDDFAQLPDRFVYNESIELQDDDIIFIGLFCKQFENTAIYKHARKIAHSYAKITRQKTIEGWSHCEHCQALVKADTICAVCVLNLQLELRTKLRELLHLSPWADYQEIRNKLIVTEKFFNQEKQTLISDLFDNKFRDKQADEKLVMLLRTIKPEEVTAEMLKQVAYNRVRGKE
jgi:hypothetical protein